MSTAALFAALANCSQQKDKSQKAAARETNENACHVLNESRTMLAICENDMTKQTVKNQYRKPEEQKQPYASDAEMKQMRQEIESASEALLKLMKSLDKLSEYRTMCERVGMQRTMMKRHCAHCKGAKTRCGCEHGCVRSDKTKCKPRHCKHCNGSSGACECSHNCDRVDGIKCRSARTPVVSKKPVPKIAKEDEEVDEEEKVESEHDAKEDE